MKDHFLLEALWVLCVYGWVSLACGLAASSAMLVWGARLVRRPWRMVVLATATLVLWIALFVGVDYGYGAWQRTPNPPAEAFSDTGGPFFMLFAGWVPSLCVLAPLHLLVRLCSRAFAHNPPPLPGRPSGPCS